MLMSLTVCVHIRHAPRPQRAAEVGDRRGERLPSMIPHIVYLHGFLSSPTTVKAQALADHLAAQGALGQFLAPTLPVEPDAAIHTAEAALMECIDERADRHVGADRRLCLRPGAHRQRHDGRRAEGLVSDPNSPRKIHDQHFPP